MKKCNKKKILSSYFIVYDLNDNPVYYFDDYDNLLQVLNYNYNYLIRKFNFYGECIPVYIDSEEYKLYMFFEH